MDIRGTKLALTEHTTVNMSPSTMLSGPSILISSKNTVKLKVLEAFSGEFPSTFTSDVHVMIYSVTVTELMSTETVDVAGSPNPVGVCEIFSRGIRGAIDQESRGVGLPREEQENRGVESGWVIMGTSTSEGGDGRV